MNENTIDSVISIYGVLELSAVSAHCSLPTKFSVFESWLLYVLLSLPERFLLIHHQDGLRTVRRQSSMMSTSAALAAELTETGCPEQKQNRRHNHQQKQKQKQFRLAAGLNIRDVSLYDVDVRADRIILPSIVTH